MKINNCRPQNKINRIHGKNTVEFNKIINN